MNTDMTDTQKVHVIIFREGDCWVAQCLEYDIGTQAKDLGDLEIQFALTYKAEQKESIERHGKPFAGIDPAPRHFYDLWEGRSGEYKPLTETPAYDMALAA